MNEFDFWLHSLGFVVTGIFIGSVAGHALGKRSALKGIDLDARFYDITAGRKRFYVLVKTNFGGHKK